MQTLKERTLPKETPFRGLSATPDAPEPERLSVCENLFRDYAAGAGGALSTIPGFRAVAALPGAVHGIYAHDGALLVHAGTTLYRVTGENAATALAGALADAPSTAFTHAGHFYMLDGTGFRVLSGDTLALVTADAPLVEINGKATAAPSFLTTRTRRLWRVDEGAEPTVTPAVLLAGSPAAYVGQDTFVEAPIVAGRIDAGLYRDTSVTLLTASGGEVTDSGGVGELPPDLLLRAGTDDLTLTAGFTTLTRHTTVWFDATGAHRIALTAVPHFSRTSPPDIRISCPVSGLDTVFNTPKNLCYLPPSVCITPGVPCRTGIRSHLTGRVGRIFAATTLPTEDVPPVVEVRTVPGNTSGRIGLYEDEGELVLSADVGFALTGDACVLFAARLETEEGVFRDFFFNIAAVSTPLPTANYRFGAVCRPRLYPAAGLPLAAAVDGESVPFGVVTDENGAPLYVAAGGGATGNVTLLFDHGQTPATFGGMDTVFAAWQNTLPQTRRAVLDGCRFCAVLGGTPVIGGNPACPRCLFFGTDDGDFRLFDVFEAPDAVTGLFAAGDALYILTATGLYRYRKGAGTGLISAVFTCSGGTAVHPVGPCVAFGGEVLLPTREGVFGFRPSAADPLETLYPRADAITPLPGAVEGAAVFEGYAALFCRGRVFLADGRTARAGGTSRWQYDWYPLSDVGVRYQKSNGVLYRTGRYRTLSEPPSAYVGKTLATAGLPVLRRPQTTVAATDVLTGTLTADGVVCGTALYTPTEGGCLLCEGPLEYDDAGDFYPAICPFTLSAAAGVNTAFFASGAPELLFFGDETGHLYLVNTDKRGQDGTLAPVWYNFDGHRIRARLLTGREDGGRPAALKSVHPGSLVAAVRAMGAPAPRLFLLTDRGGLFEAGAGDGGLAFDDFSFAGVGFVGDGVRHVAFVVAPRRFSTLRFALEDGGFCAPFGLYSLHYGYTVAGRIGT